MLVIHDIDSGCSSAGGLLHRSGRLGGDRVFSILVLVVENREERLTAAWLS
jgi:hypothetical protein